MAHTRVVAITGASAGIGRATALRLARDGASVAICARRHDLLARVAADIDRVGGHALPLTADVTIEQDMAHLVRRTVERFRRLDAMICNTRFPKCIRTRRRERSSGSTRWRPASAIAS